jgi:hypothetical protein
MSDLHREAMLLHVRGLLEHAIAQHRTMLAVNAVRLHRGEPPAYTEQQLEHASEMIGHHIVDPRNFE